MRRAGHEGWTQESRVLSAPNVVATDTATVDSAIQTPRRTAQETPCGPD